ncbi:MAG: MBL fold metallo-hydrolase [bacterium]
MQKIQKNARNKKIKITFLGTGTSCGIPVIGCNCSVCNSDNPKDNRTRSSIVVEEDGLNILVDTSPDLRFQALRSGLKKIDLVLFTHGHADHIHGLDELRQYNNLQRQEIPCYGNQETIDDLYRRYDYIFKKTQEGGGKPRLSFNVIEKPLTLNGLTIQPIKIRHGELNILGYRINDLAYLTDCSYIPDASKGYLYGLKLLILDALRREKHSTHFSLGEAIEVVNELKPKQALFTHICHQLSHNETNNELPSHIQLAHDGQIIDLSSILFNN